MAQEPGLSDQYPRASPWPIPLVLGLVISELGLLIDGILPVAVGGLLLFAASIVGILRESRYTESMWRTTLALGAVFAVLGGVVYTQTGADQRGLALAVTAVIVAGGGVALFLLETERL
ncbi:DUF7541 family protein [Halobacterium zhouii]|uniref:DUF7541 family protein n=1 Tax=Halobacterium zhouii TaxID=2902624 RepID=UPI001E4A0B92|nr:hypothetical protein [Halobacterium zhouii]